MLTDLIAVDHILHGAKTGKIDSETRFYVLWKWSYGDAKVAVDEAFKLAQALGIDTEEMWDRTGVLEKQGQNVQALTVTKRMRIKDLGEPNVDGSPATLIDTLHRCCAFRDKGDTRRLTNRLRKYAEYIFTFLDYEHVPFDNNFAERQIRPAVILRKNSQSNRSDRGAAAQAILMSVYRTLKLRGLNPTKTIADALRTYLATGQLPPLPEAHIADG